MSDKDNMPVGITPVKENHITYSGNEYHISEVFCPVPEVNTILIAGKTLGVQRKMNYGKEEAGYVLEAKRISDNVFAFDTLWLQLKASGWADAESIDNELELEFVRCILQAGGIELIFGNDPINN